jgi:hypothetical protein
MIVSSALGTPASSRVLPRSLALRARLPHSSPVRASWALAIAVLASVCAACGGRPPPPAKGVIQGDIDSWRFRRYQEVLDVEVWVPNNQASAFTASYVRDEAEKRGRIEDKDIASAFVTRYAKDVGILREVMKFARRLAQDGGYTVEETSIEGVRCVLIEGHGETWALWSAPRHVVKVGGRQITKVPGDLVEAYGERYPSTLVGDILEGPLPPAEDVPEKDDEDDEVPDDPNNPKPDWDKYKTGTGSTPKKDDPDDGEDDE